LILIDGSYGEGGGQILRTSLALSALLGKSVEIINIRKGRANPGLQPQHLTGVVAIQEISGGRLQGADLGSQKLRFYPGEIRGADYDFDVSRIKGSAGSTGLVFQTIAPPLLFAKKGVNFTIKGGPHTQWSPPIDYIQHVFLPIARRMGIRAEISLVKWGWYPVGGGLIEGKVEPVECLEGLELKKRGDLINVKILSAVSNLPLSIAQRQKDQAYRRLKGKGFLPEVEIIEPPALGTGTFVFILAQFEGSLAGFSSLGQRGKPAERVADEAVEEFFQYYDSGAALEGHLADQLILYMALARGKSSITTSRISSHLLTNIWVVEKFLPLKFNVEGELGGAGQISVQGFGFKRQMSTVNRPDDISFPDID